MSTMPSPPALTRAQRDVLQAAARGEVSKTQVVGRDFGTWRVGGNRGRGVTVPAQALIRKNLARIATAPVDGRLPLAVTAAGYEALSAGVRRAR